MLENLLQTKQSDFVIECGWSAIKEIRCEMTKRWVSLVGKKTKKNQRKNTSKLSVSHFLVCKSGRPNILVILNNWHSYTWLYFKS